MLLGTNNQALFASIKNLSCISQTKMRRAQQFTAATMLGMGYMCAVSKTRSKQMKPKSYFAGCLLDASWASLLELLFEREIFSERLENMLETQWN